MSLNTVVKVLGAGSFVRSFEAMTRVVGKIADATAKASAHKMNNLADAQQKLERSSVNAERYRKVFLNLGKSLGELRDVEVDYSKKLDYCNKSKKKSLDLVEQYRNTIISMPTGAKAVLLPQIYNELRNVQTQNNSIKAIGTDLQKVREQISLLAGESRTALINYGNEMRNISAARAFISSQNKCTSSLKIFAEQLGITKESLLGYVKFLGISLLFAAQAFISKIMYDVSYMKKQLIQVFGSEEAGSQAWEWAKSFSLTGKADLKGLVEGFVMLIRLGIQPTERRMESLKDLALLSRRSIENVSKAIALASHGQFRNLHYLGIDKRQIMQIDPTAFIGSGSSARVASSEKVVNAIFKYLESPTFKGKAKLITTGFTGEILKLRNFITVFFANISEDFKQGYGNIINPFRQIFEFTLKTLYVGFKSFAFVFNLLATGVKKVSSYITPLAKSLLLIATIAGVYKGLFFVLGWFRGLSIAKKSGEYLIDFCKYIAITIKFIRLLTYAQIQQAATSIITAVINGWSSFVGGLSRMIKAIKALITIIKALTTAEKIQAVVSAIAQGIMGNWVSIAAGAIAGIALYLALFKGLPALARLAENKFDSLFKKLGLDIPDVANLLGGINQELGETNQELGETVTILEKLKQTSDNTFNSRKDVFSFYRRIAEASGFGDKTLQLLDYGEAKLLYNRNEKLKSIQKQLVQDVFGKDKAESFFKNNDFMLIAEYNKMSVKDILNDKIPVDSELEKKLQTIRDIGKEILDNNARQVELTTKLKDIEKSRREIIGGGDLASIGVKQYELWKKIGNKVYRSSVDKPKFKVDVEAKSFKGLEEFVKNISEQVISQTAEYIMSQGAKAFSNG